MVVIVGADLRRMHGFGHRGVDRAGRDGVDANAELRQFGGLHGDRLRADQFADLGGADIIRAPLEALHVGDRIDFLVGEDALRRPRNREQQHHALRGELLFDRRLRHLPELHRFRIAGGEKRHDVDAVDRVFVFVQRHQDFAHLRLAGLHRALDVRRLEQRRRRVNGDVQFAAGRGRNVLGEQNEVFAVRIIGRIGRNERDVVMCRLSVRFYNYVGTVLVVKTSRYRDALNPAGTPFAAAPARFAGIR